MFNREHLETFAVIVEEQSFSGAAKVLNVTPGAVSQRIRALEQSLCKSLLLRDVPVVPTKFGEVMLRHVQALRLLERTSLAQMQPHGSSNTAIPITIAVDAHSLATWFPASMWQCMQAEQLHMDVIVDELDCTVARLMRGEVIGCVSSQKDSASGCVADALGCMELRCCATADYYARAFAGGFTLQAARLQTAVLTPSSELLHKSFLDCVFGVAPVRFNKHVLPTPNLVFDAVKQGVGYGLLPTLQVRAALQSGDLVDMAPNNPLHIPLFWHRRQSDTEMLNKFADDVMQRALATLVHVNI
jgi:LysR family transcriptional regulator (chromosome initiation inhibitor)